MTETPVLIKEMVAIGNVTSVVVERSAYDNKWSVWAYWDTGLGHRIKTVRWRWVAGLYAIAVREMFRQEGVDL